MEVRHAFGYTVDAFGYSSNGCPVNYGYIVYFSFYILVRLTGRTANSLYSLNTEEHICILKVYVESAGSAGNPCF